jgi:hypothetical protein
MEVLVMTATNILAARASAAHERALAVIEKYGDEQTIEHLANTTGGPNGTGLRNPQRDPLHALVLHAELIGALASIVEELEEKASERWAQPSTAKAQRSSK